MSFECWIFSHFVWSHRVAASLGNCSLHPTVTSVCVIPSYLNSSHVFSAFFTASHLIPSHVFSPILSSSQLITTVLFSSHVIWAFLISFHPSFSAFLRFSQLFSALCRSCQLILRILISSSLLSHLLSSSHTSSANLSSWQLVTPHLRSPQRALKSSLLSSGWKPAPKTDLGAKANDPWALHREDLTQRSVYTQQAFAQRSLEACTHRNFFTETGKLLSTASF